MATAYAITSLSPEQAHPERLLALWREHWVRDATFGEDRCQGRSGAAAPVLAALRNLVSGLLRLVGHSNMAAVLRHYSWKPEAALQLSDFRFRNRAEPYTICPFNRPPFPVILDAVLIATTELSGVSYAPQSLPVEPTARCINRRYAPMPAKGRRIASRQAQLGRRRRQSRKTEEGGTVTVAAPADIPTETAATANGAAAAPAASTPTTDGMATAATPARSPRRSGLTRTDRAAAYTHLGAELRRILILAGILLAVLLGLSFAL